MLVLLFMLRCDLLLNRLRGSDLCCVGPLVRYIVAERRGEFLPVVGEELALTSFAFIVRLRRLRRLGLVASGCGSSLPVIPCNTRSAY